MQRRPHGNVRRRSLQTSGKEQRADAEDITAETFARVCGLPARFRQTPIEQIRDFDAQLAQMFTFFNEHPAELADLPALRADHPGLMRLETWLRATRWKP